jgi:hypothetical protein
MTGSLNVDPNQLVEIGGHWYRLVPELQGTPPGGKPGRFASDAGAAAVTGAAGLATGNLQEQLGAAAGQMQASGGSYGNTEGMNSSSMKDMVATFTASVKDIGGLVTSTGQAGASAAGGIIGPTASGTASAISSVTSGLVGALAHTGGAPAAGAALEGTPDHQHPDQQVSPQESQQQGGH